MKHNCFKFHAFRKVIYLFAECICNVIFQVLSYSSAKDLQKAAVGQYNLLYIFMN